jgi:predicted DNA-binding helix-hairpin-helix protein
MGQAVDDKDGRVERWRGDALRPINIRNLHGAIGSTRIFRILLTNACSFSCSYCPMQAGRQLDRHSIPPEKLAEIFVDAHRRGWVDGLFITTGIPKSPIFAMDRLIALVELVRFHHRFAGYIHAKAVAGAEPAQIERLAALVDRLSYNLESQCEETLKRVAPEKSVASGLEVLNLAAGIARNQSVSRDRRDPRPPGRTLRAGLTTQIVVGLGDETDQEILETTTRLTRSGTIHHSHFAAFRPIAGTPLEGRPETPALRELRLYQAEHLLREYGFEREEIVFDPAGRIPFSHDPKLTWALAHQESFPMELTVASREQLLRVPGLGRKAVDKLLAIRGSLIRFTRGDLRRLAPRAARASGFLAFRGRRLGEFLAQPFLIAPEEIQSSRIYAFSPGTFR